MIEERTAPIEHDETSTEPVWGQKFFFDFNPHATLDVVLMNEQYLTSETIGQVRIPVISILEGLQRAEGQACCVSLHAPSRQIQCGPCGLPMH